MISREVLFLSAGPFHLMLEQTVVVFQRYLCLPGVGKRSS